MEGSQATQGTLTQATQPSDPGPLQSPKDSAELVVKLLKKLLLCFSGGNGEAQRAADMIKASGITLGHTWNQHL